MIQQQAFRTTVAVLALAIGGLQPTPAGAGGGEEARAVVELISSRVIDVLVQKGASAAEKRQQVEKIVYANTNFDVLTRLVLGQNLSKFNDAQRGAFTEEFRRHLSMTYGRNVEDYKNEKVQLTGDREEARGDWTVNTKILRGGGDKDVLVDYRLRKGPEGWRVIDMTIERVSLVANFRAQFQELLAHGTPDELVRTLRDKNEKGEPLKSDNAS